MAEAVHTRALIPGDRASGYRERITDVIDTGERRTRSIDGCHRHGRTTSDGSHSTNREALVHVPGEREPWWIEAERLEPAQREARIAWLRSAEEARPVVERRMPVAEDDVRRASRRAAQRRYKERQRAAEASR